MTLITKASKVLISLWH